MSEARVDLFSVNTPGEPVEVDIRDPQPLDRIRDRADRGEDLAAAAPELAHALIVVLLDETAEQSGSGFAAVHGNTLASTAAPRAGARPCGRGVSASIESPPAKRLVQRSPTI
jgi:hypothetical protein